MDLSSWIRSRAATRQPLNIHAVARERPDLLDQAFAGPSPHGWRRSLIDAGVDPYKIVIQYEDLVECAICGLSFVVLGKHLSSVHDMTGEEYHKEFGPDCATTSEAYRSELTCSRTIAGIAHWERLWSSYYVIDWLLLLNHEKVPLNAEHLHQAGTALERHARKLFGSWDGALRAAGLDPAVLRAKPPERQWTHTMVIEGLRNFAKLKKENPKRQMSTPLKMAMRRFFPTGNAACQAAGIAYEAINPRASFKDEAVARLVAAIRALEPLKGRERLKRLEAIYRKTTNQRIVTRNYGSLRRLAAKEGIPLRVVAREAYRDEADVHHDLDLLESEVHVLTDGLIRRRNSGLRLVMMQTGWGEERVKRKVVTPIAFPPCNPRSGLLCDRMIILRRRLRIGIAAAADKAGICSRSWGEIERGQHKPSVDSIRKIERLLAEYDIPV